VSYRKLYEFAQTPEAYDGKQYLSRNALRDKAQELTGKTVKHARMGVDVLKVRGLWISMSNQKHHLVQQFGCNVIVTQRELNRCWERFVFVKELMHLFDSQDGHTQTSEQFEHLLGEFSSLEVGESAQWQSDARAVWRALALFCTEDNRKVFAAQRRAVMISDYDIALRLKIPEFHVPKLMSTNYLRVLETILDD